MGIARTIITVLNSLLVIVFAKAIKRKGIIGNE